MHLRNSIFNPKKFFKRTINSIKSFLSGGYEKLPKTTPFNPFSCSGNSNMKFSHSYRELDKFYTDFNTQLDRDEEKSEKIRNKKRKEGSLKGDDDERERGRDCLVEEKLKELEMMDKSNVEHVLDIEEVLHYYSRITCPAYIEIVDKFFMDMYSELFTLQSSACDYKSRPRIRS